MKITTVKDYLEQLQEKFPEVSKEDIKRILEYGWKSLYLHNSYGGDTLLSDKNLWCYIGYLKKDPVEHFNYYKKKLIVKLRVLYRKRKIPWDGYYYFALSQEEYDKYIGPKNKKGRPKKKFTFQNIFLYQILDECKIQESSKQYIFRIPYIDYIKIKFYVKSITTDKSELILKRDPLKFKDILVSENKYEYL